MPHFQCKSDVVFIDICTIKAIPCPFIIRKFLIQFSAICPFTERCYSISNITISQIRTGFNHRSRSIITGFTLGFLAHCINIPNPITVHIATPDIWSQAVIAGFTSSFVLPQSAVTYPPVAIFSDISRCQDRRFPCFTVLSIPIAGRLPVVRIISPSASVQPDSFPVFHLNGPMVGDRRDICPHR